MARDSDSKSLHSFHRRLLVEQWIQNTLYALFSKVKEMQLAIEAASGKEKSLLSDLEEKSKTISAIEKENSNIVRNDVSLILIRVPMNFWTVIGIYFSILKLDLILFDPIIIINFKVTKIWKSDDSTVPVCPICCAKRNIQAPIAPWSTFFVYLSKFRARILLFGWRGYPPDIRDVTDRTGELCI